MTSSNFVQYLTPSLDVIYGRALDSFVPVKHIPPRSGRLSDIWTESWILIATLRYIAKTLKNLDPEKSRIKAQKKPRREKSRDSNLMSRKTPDMEVKDCLLWIRYDLTKLVQPNMRYMRRYSYHVR